MQDTLYHKENLKILGKLFKRYREENGYSVRGISRSHNIAHTVVSQIENAKIHPNLETLKVMFSALGIDLKIDDDYIKEHRKNILNLFDAIYYMDEEKRKTYRNILQEEYENLMHSVLRMDVQMVLGIDRLNETKDRNSVDISEVMDAYEYLSNEQKANYNILLGLYHYYNKAYSAAVKYLIHNLESIGEDKKYVFSLYYLAFSSHKLYRNHLSFSYADKATRFLARHNNLRRKLEIDLLKTQKQIDNASYNDANSILLNLENSMRYHTNKEQTMQRFNTIKVYIAYSSKDYEEALRYIEVIDVQTPMYLFLKALILHRLDRREEAIHHFKKVEVFEATNPDNQFVLLGRLMHHHLTGDISDENIEWTINEITKNPYRFISIHLYYLAFDLILDYYERRRKYKKVLEITQIMLSVAKIRDIHETNHM